MVYSTTMNCRKKEYLKLSFILPSHPTPLLCTSASLSKIRSRGGCREGGGEDLFQKYSIGILTKLFYEVDESSNTKSLKINKIILMPHSLLFSRSGVCGINCWTIQKGKILRFKRGFWTIRRFSSGTSFWSRNHGNLDVGCATEDSGKVWKLLTLQLAWSKLSKNENDRHVNKAIWNYIVILSPLHNK